MPTETAETAPAPETTPVVELPHYNLRLWAVRCYDRRKYRRDYVGEVLPEQRIVVQAHAFQAARELAEGLANFGLKQPIWSFSSDQGEDLTEPVEGMGATFTLWTDAHACTVVDVHRNNEGVPTRAVLRRDRAELLNGFASGEKDALTFSPGGFFGHTSGTQRHRYTEDPAGELITVSRRRDRDGGIVWKRVGVKTTERGGYARFGIRSEHYDHNF